MDDTKIIDLQKDIAIIGMSGRFPMSRDLDEFWQNLRGGVECISSLSDAELHSAGVDPSLVSNPNYVKAKGVIDDAGLFDASFFEINHREAEIIDPQQRLFLEHAWTALENAGYDSETYEGLVGVYAGASFSSYLMNNLRANRDMLNPAVRFQTAIGNDKDYLSTRVSYKLNLRGPSIAIQTACSTSLVAVVYACHGLLSYQCDIALAGGVSISIPQKAGYLYQEGMISSPDGHCRAFDAKAGGTVWGDGLGIVVLKRLVEALADGDCIHAVIKGSAVNNDGSLKVGYTAPSVDGQAEVIATAQAIAGIDAGSISYVEAHGTGTPMGDPIELTALTKAFRFSTEKRGFCAIGSVKTNIGHLDAAAGVAGLIKTVLALENKQLPPSLHFLEPNPKIDFDESPFYVNTKLSEWTTLESPRRAGVSSFGVGGTNAHVVVEEAPKREISSTSRPCQLLVLSTKTYPALTTATENLVKHIKGTPDLNLADLAYTLQVGRRRFRNRRMIVCQNIEEAAVLLDTVDHGQVYTVSDESDNRDVVFIFSGQGSQYVNMASELYQVEPAFQKTVDLCSEILIPQLGCDLRNIIYSDEKRLGESARRLTQTSITQPALFVIEYALAGLLMKWGIEPQAMIGHSIGEYVAACLAGVLSLEDGLLLVATRGRLMAQLPAGSMLAVPLPEKEAQAFLGGELSLAAVNAPSACVVSGPFEAVDQLEKKLAEKGIEGRRLHTSHAFHSHMMEPILNPFKDQVRKVRLNAPQIPYLSNVSGTWITKEQATDPNYWALHLRHTVRFSEGMGELLKEPGRVLLEIGPGETLTSLARRRADKAAGQVILSSIRHPREQQSDVAFLLGTLGKLWLAGIKVNWAKFYEGERRHRVALPTYPFERQRYWVEPPKEPSDGIGMKRTIVSSVQRQDVNDWFYAPSWKQSMPPFPREENGGIMSGTRWLVFVDAGGVGGELAKQLELKNHEVVTVMAGEQFAARNGRSYTIRPGQPDDYNALLETLARSDRLPEGIVHMWTVSPAKREGILLAEVEASQAFGFYSLLYLAQALGRQKMANPFHLWVVSNNLHDVTGDEKLRPEKATILGPCKTIPQEYTNITCRFLDVEISKNVADQKSRLTDQLLAEINSAAADPIVAYRGRHRWVPTYEPVKLDPVPGKNPRLREGGVYLITGGMGGIGLVMAEYLARSVTARLVLVGRSAVPDHGQWEQWLTTHGEGDETSRRILKVQALEKMGAEVLLASADVTSLEQMKQVVAQAKERFGRINGVIHGAGVPGGGVIQLKSPEAAAKVLAPKVKGTLVLDEVLKDIPLDWFVLCSSTFAVTSRFGQVDYCAANSFLDAFAHYKSSTNGIGAISINWDGWREVGMAVNAAASVRANSNQSEGQDEGILPSQGVEAFKMILAQCTVPQVVVSTRELQPVFQPGSFAVSPHAEQSKPASAAPFEYARPDLRTAYIAPLSEAERILAEIWQEVLGIAQVGKKDDFFELGGDSLIAVRLMSKIAETLKIEMPLHSLLEARTIERFAEMLTAEKGGENLNKSADLSWNGKREAATDKLAKTEPRTSTERRLSSIWERILNTRHIGIRDSFIGLQDDSNLFDSMLAEVRREFGVFSEGLPIKAIYEEPTIEALARVIDDTIKPTKTLVVGLQARGSKRPLFLIHAGGGYVFFYRALAYRLGEERPVYAVRAETISDGKGRPFDRSKSIEELAARYIEEIKAVQPKGPYFLGGASLGGVIAFEMARQLESQGEELAGPVLLFSAIVANNLCARDAGASPPGRLGQRIGFLRQRASAYGRLKGGWYFFYKVLRNGPYEIKKFIRAISRRLQNLASEVLENLESLLPIKWEVPYEVKQQRIMKRFMEATNRLLFDYTPGVFKGSVVLFKASHYSHLEQWWAGLSQGGMTVHKMPGGHLDMLEEPAVIETAALVSKYLDEGVD